MGEVLLQNSKMHQFKFIMGEPKLRKNVYIIDFYFKVQTKLQA